MFNYDKHALIYLFDTCNLSCGYCNLAGNGYVKDSSQLTRYEDVSRIDKIVSFFKEDKLSKWRVSLTGGEPTMMPNFEYFVDSLASDNLKISIFTNLTMSHKSSSFEFMMDRSEKFYAIFATLHNEYFNHTEYFFEKVKLLKKAGTPIVVKLILTPKSLHLLELLDEKCRELDVGFMPMSLLTENYPHSYTQLEKNHIKKYIYTSKQVIHLFGGLDVSCVKCNAGNKIINIDARSGNIYPCADLYPPFEEMGNIFDSSFKFYSKSSSCLKYEKVCLCDFHYENNIIEGYAEDISPLLEGYVEPMSDEEVELIVSRYKLTQQISEQISVRKDKVDNYKNESRQIKQLQQICEERLELIDRLSDENEKRLAIIKQLTEKINKLKR